MRTELRFLTWLDVRRMIRRKTQDGRAQLPAGILSMECFSDALEISLSNLSCQETAITAINILQEWFGEWYIPEKTGIALGLGDTVLPIEFVQEDRQTPGVRQIRPFWEEISYINQSERSDDQASIAPQELLPEPFTAPPEIFAFYSFKGGVGRTLHLAAHLFALLERSRELNQSIKVLVIDADLEAPGLTYWERLEKQTPSVSFIDFLEAYHYTPVPIEQMLLVFAQEIQKSSRIEGKSTVYVLPACLNDDQLLDMPVLPEHLARGVSGPWTCGDAIQALGQKLQADYILIDLRAGISEISSPIIFDPRIHRFLVTPASEQSISGISLVLNQISHIVPTDTQIENGQYHDPSVILSLLTPELRKIDSFDDALERLRNSYNLLEPESNELYSQRLLEIKETEFAQELLHINSWDEARTKLTSNSTTVMQVAREWASTQLLSKRLDGADDLQNTNPELHDSDALRQVTSLKEICQKYEFAESGQGESLLVTEPLRNLATSFRSELPRVVSIGAKGAGKTFTYIQIARFKYWGAFLNKVLGENSQDHSQTYVFPLLESSTIHEDARKILTSCRNEVISKLGENAPEFIFSECKDRILRKLSDLSLEAVDWTLFWIEELARSIGAEPPSSGTHTLSSINQNLTDRDLKVIFLVDGLEDIFTQISSNPQQQKALHALVDLPRRLGELRRSSVGIIILLRRDFLRHILLQNMPQFEHLYKAYDLFWDVDSFLRLVYWICSQAQVIDADESTVSSLSRSQLIQELQKLWGKKLGADKSNEAYTPSWIFAALTDFKGRLQARDIVRFLYHAADIAITQADVQFGRWSLLGRILPPQAIRRALVPCSTKKVDETDQEYADFKQWRNQIDQLYTREKRFVPFLAENFDLSQATILMLEEIGVIYGDTEKDGIVKFYMPEIFRTGLNFSLKAGARPRVLVLKRKALGPTGLL